MWLDAGEQLVLAHSLPNFTLYLAQNILPWTEYFALDRIVGRCGRRERQMWRQKTLAADIFHAFRVRAKRSYCGRILTGRFREKFGAG
jgi:hypothetical protein